MFLKIGFEPLISTCSTVTILVKQYSHLAGNAVIQSTVTEQLEIPPEESLKHK